MCRVDTWLTLKCTTPMVREGRVAHLGPSQATRARLTWPTSPATPHGVPGGTGSRGPPSSNPWRATRARLTWPTSGRGERGEPGSRGPPRTLASVASLAHVAHLTSPHLASDEGPAHVAHLGPWRARRAWLTWPTSYRRERAELGSRGPPRTAASEASPAHVAHLGSDVGPAHMAHLACS